MTMNGMRDDFTLANLQNCAVSAGMKRDRAEEITEEMCAAFFTGPTLPRKPEPSDAGMKPSAKATASYSPNASQNMAIMFEFKLKNPISLPIG